MNKVMRIRQTPEQKVYWVSDTHLNHNRNFVYEVRGHKTSQEHTDFIINKVNEIVRPNDILMHGGDFCLNTEENGLNALLARIHCQNIYMTWGNHNNPLWKVYQREVKKVLVPRAEWENEAEFPVEAYPFRYKNVVFLGNYAEITVDGQYFVLCHYPIHVWNYVKDGCKMICGHSHYGLPFSQADNLDAKILDVGWDGYCRPLSTEEILEIMNTKRIFATGDHHEKPTRADE
jgi:calcineurin-like phosphoesterase family protein